VGHDTTKVIGYYDDAAFVNKLIDALLITFTQLDIFSATDDVLKISLTTALIFGDAADGSASQNRYDWSQ